MTGIHYESGRELDTLDELFPSLRNEIVGKDVVDFGCGYGYQAVALARAGARSVLGIELDEAEIEAVRNLAAQEFLSDCVSAARTIPDGYKADIVISKNSFEHFIDAGEVLKQMQACLKPGGKIFITFAPPWNAPWGAHMGYFCRLPWVHLLFSEATIMAVRRVFRGGPELTYREVGLAQMSLSRFERIIAGSGPSLEYLRYDCVRGMDWLANTFARELFVNRVSCMLTT
jgi:SAM-dependent methyltransferase